MNQTFPLLSTLIFFPLAGALLLMLLPRRNALFIKASVLIWTLLEFALSLPLFFHFNDKPPRCSSSSSGSGTRNGGSAICSASTASACSW